MLTEKRRAVLKSFFEGSITPAEAIKLLNTTRSKFNTLKDEYAKEKLAALT
jgi:hypothetical protein